MKNFANAPWGWIVIFSWLARIPFTLITLTGLGFSDATIPMDESIAQIYFVIDFIAIMLGGVEIFTFGCWIVALILRRKLRRDAAIVVAED